MTCFRIEGKPEVAIVKRNLGCVLFVKLGTLTSYQDHAKPEKMCRE